MTIRKLYVQTGIEILSNDPDADIEKEVKDTVAMIGCTHENPDGDKITTKSVRIVNLHTGKLLCNEGEFH